MAEEPMLFGIASEEPCSQDHPSRSLKDVASHLVQAEDFYARP